MNKDLTYVEVIPSSGKAQEIYLNTVKGATAEVLWIFPTANAFTRQDKIGAIPLAKKGYASSKRKKCKS